MWKILCKSFSNNSEVQKFYNIIQAFIRKLQENIQQSP